MGNRCLSIALRETAVSSGAVVFIAMCDRSRLAAEAARDAAVKMRVRKPAERRLSEGQSGTDLAAEATPSGLTALGRFTRKQGRGTSISWSVKGCTARIVDLP